MPTTITLALLSVVCSGVAAYQRPWYRTYDIQKDEAHPALTYTLRVESVNTHNADNTQPD